MVEYNGQLKHLADWAEEFGLPRQIVANRLHNYKWDIHRALTEKVGPRGRTTNQSKKIREAVKSSWDLRHFMEPKNIRKKSS